MAMFAWMDLFIGQSMSSDKSLKETLETNNKKPWVETTQGFFMLVCVPFVLLEIFIVN